MRRHFVILLVISLGIVGLNAQEVVTGIVPGRKVFKPYLSVGAGPSFSVINNRMEIRGQYKPGYHVFLDLYTKDWFCWSMEYTWFPLHNSDPALINIDSWNAEGNANLLFDIGETDMRFKTLFGLGYMDWSGTYVGPSMKDKNTWAYGMRLNQHWIFGNLGCGVERNFGENFTISGDFRLRFASDEGDLVSISDTGFFIGLQWNARFNRTSGQSEPGGRKRSRNDKRSRVYKWLKNR